MNMSESQQTHYNEDFNQSYYHRQKARLRWKLKKTLKKPIKLPDILTMQYYAEMKEGTSQAKKISGVTRLFSQESQGLTEIDWFERRWMTVEDVKLSGN